MPHDEVIAELWRIKDEIAAEYNYDIHALVMTLRDDEQKHPQDLFQPKDLSPPQSPRETAAPSNP